MQAWVMGTKTCICWERQSTEKQGVPGGDCTVGTEEVPKVEGSVFRPRTVNGWHVSSSDIA